MTIDEFFDELAKREDLKWEKLGGHEIRCRGHNGVPCCPITALSPWPYLMCFWQQAARKLQLSSKDARKLANAADGRYASLRKRMLAACRLGEDFS